MRINKLLVFLVILLLLLSLFWLWFEQQLKPVVFSVAEAKAQGVALRAISEAIESEIVKTVKYEELIDIQTDKDGYVVLLQPNTVEINNLSAKASISVGDFLKVLSEDDISIKFGQVMGSQILADMGPLITVKLFPLGTVKSVLVDEFEQAGINQTRHKISIDIEAVVRMVMPGMYKDVSVRQIIPITEAVIIGKVPQSYTNIVYTP